MISFEQQDRWLRARIRLSLDPSRQGFGRAGLFEMLDGPGIAVVALPGDVLAQPIDFSVDLPGSVLPQCFEGLTANGVALLSGETSTSTALVRYAPGDDGRWRAFMALDRNGGIHGAIGSVSRYQLDEGRHVGSAVLRLFMLAHLIRAVVEAQTRAVIRAASEAPPTIGGPFEVTAAVPDSSGLVLGGLNEGWEEPKYDFDPPRSIEDHVMARLQLDEWPTSEHHTEELVLRVLDRACEAFGNRRQPYLSRVSPTAGTMSRRYA